MPKESDMESHDDGAFVVYKTRFGTWASYDKEGKSLCSSGDKDACVYWSREHLNNFKTSNCYATNVSTNTDLLK